MVFGLFFDSNFAKLVGELEMAEFGDVITENQLVEIRNYSKNVLGVKPEEAAARAFKDLVMFNSAIPLESRLRKSLEKINKIKWWHFDKKVNVDLYLSIRAAIAQMTTEYVGGQYEAEFLSALGEWGVIVPIEHDTLRTFSLLYMAGNKKTNKTADTAAHDFFTEVVVKGGDKYVSCIREEAHELLRVLHSIEGRK